MGSRRCHACGHGASERARFCERCGAALVPGAQPLRAPSSLEAKILSQRAGIEGERKQVTVMYADVVGSMALTAALDAERWGFVLDRFLALAARAVHAFEGTVNQFTGDGLLAVFGAPIAHEDHARRACLAVLGLQRDVVALAAEIQGTDGVEFAARCGLHSGEVVVGAIGDDVHMDFVPVGNTTALGQRIEALAPSGSIAISSATAALVDGEFELRELGEFELKGMPGRQRILELVGRGPAPTRLKAMAVTRGLTTFVGREAERTMLEAALQRAQAGQGCAVGIVGEAGVGKSRLLHEFTADCASRGMSVSSASGVAHGRFVSFLPILALYRDRFGVSEDDPPEVLREQLGTRLQALDPSFGPDLPLLFEFLGLADPVPQPTAPDAVTHRRQLMDVAIRALTALGPQEAGVLVLEDLHWIDDASDAFLEELVEAVRGAGILLVTTYRSEYVDAWAGSDPHYRIELGPLEPHETGALLAGLLGSDPSLSGLPSLIEARTGGNPFFIEEVVQALYEAGQLSGRRGAYRLDAAVAELTLPATVQAGLAARIDRLPAREKSLVQTMSVIGQEVPGPLLEELSGLDRSELADAVELLERGQWLLPHPAHPRREYTFKHSLTQEVAYQSQLSQWRARAHRSVAAAIERIYPDALDERAALLAHHYESAGDGAAPAAAWHARAADWAQAASPVESMRHWRRVHELTGELDVSAERDELAARSRIGLLSLAWRVGMSPDETAAIHAAAYGDLERARADLYFSGFLMHSGREREGLEGFRAVSRQAIAAGHPGLTLVSATGMAYARWVAGELREGVTMLDHALPAADADPHLGTGDIFGCPAAHGYQSRGLCRGYLGELDAARADFHHGIELAREYGDPETVAAAQANLALLEANLGEHEIALEIATRGRAEAERGANAIHVIACTVPAAVAEAGLGRFDTALDLAGSSLASMRQRRVGLYFEPVLLATIARVRVALGKPGEAVDAAEEAVAIATARGLETCALPAHITLAHVLRKTQHPAAADRIDALLTRALRQARRTGAHVFEAAIRRERELQATG